MIRCSKPLSVIVLSVLLSLVFMCGAAQETPDFPHLLYFDENGAMLLNILTLKTTALPVEFKAYDTILWSPDGRYLMHNASAPNLEALCIRLYDVVQGQWFDDQPIACGVSEATFDSTGSSVMYFHLQQQAIITFNILTSEHSTLYQHTPSQNFNPEWIEFINWSPDGRYLTFVIAVQIMGGSLNSLKVLNIETQDTFDITARDPYYASYNPIWRDDSVWFLLRVQDEYVTSGMNLNTNHRGDVYLVNAADGSIKRLTYTPAEFEHDLGWDKNGNIQYTVIQTITLEEALAIPDVSDDQIIKPEPIPFFAMFSRVAVESPDHQLVALTDPDINSEGDTVWSNISISCINSSRFISEIRIDSKVDRILWSPNSDKVLGYLCDQ